MAPNPAANSTLENIGKGHPITPQQLGALVGLMKDDEKLPYALAAYGALLKNHVTGSGKEEELRKQLEQVRGQLDMLMQAPARLGLVFDILSGDNGQRRAIVALDGGSLYDIPLTGAAEVQVGDRVGVVMGADGAFVANGYGHHGGGVNARYVGRENGQLLLKDDREEVFRAAPAPTCAVEQLVAEQSVVRVILLGAHGALAMGLAEELETEGVGLLDPMPRETLFCDIAGLDATIREIQTKVRVWYNGALADAYNLNPRRPLIDRKRGVMLVGPPGTGKTELTHAAYSFACELAGCEVPGFELTSAGLLSHWFGMSGKNVKKAADYATSRGTDQTPSICAFQDFEQLVMDRRNSDMSVVARITTTMNQILDNKERRFVGLATANVPELVDSAVLERWHIIYVPIPDENGVRAILAHKLGLTLSAEPIDDVVEVVVAAMRGDFLKVTIAGQTRDYQRLDLLSGRKVTKAVEQAAETAAVRDADFGLRRPTGVCAEDIIASLTTQFENVGRSISPHNAASHLPLTIEEAQQVTHIHVVRRDTCRASATSFARVMN